MNKHFTLTTKGFILVSIPLFFQLGFLGILTKMQWTNAEAQQQANHSKEVRAQAYTVLQKMVDAETGMRGFNLYNDAHFLEPYERAVQEVPAELRRLKQLVRDNSASTRRADEVAAKADDALAWLTETEQLVIENQQERKRVLLEERGREEKRRMDAFREEVKGLLDAEEVIENQRDRQLAESRARVYGLVVVGGVAAPLLTGLLGLFFSRRIGGRFALLSANTQRLAAGKELTPLLGGSDEFGRLDKVFHDLADALADAARQKRAYTETLEQRVMERTAELTAVNRDLAEKNRENETFVYSVSHDLRSPLVNLQGFSKELVLSCDDLRALLKEDGVPPHVRDRGIALLDADVAEAVRFILTGVTRLSNIINALLRLSRAGRLEYQWQLVEVQALVRRVATSMRGTAEKHGAVVQFDALPPVWGDPTALEQLFANLIGNALNYLHPQRPGRVEVGCVAPEPGATASDSRTYFVRDNGLGIAEAHLHKIFHAFQRLHPDLAEGEGMGLAIVERIVERHRGKVWVESAVGVGSTFFVTLPNQTAKPLNNALIAAPSQ